MFSQCIWQRGGILLQLPIILNFLPLSGQFVPIYDLRNVIQKGCENVLPHLSKIQLLFSPWNVQTIRERCENKCSAANLYWNKTFLNRLDHSSLFSLKYSWGSNNFSYYQQHWTLTTLNINNSIHVQHLA